MQKYKHGVKKSCLGQKVTSFFSQINTSIWGKNKLAHKRQNLKLPNFLLAWVCRDIHYQSTCQLWHVYAKDF